MTIQVSSSRSCINSQPGWTIIIKQHPESISIETTRVAFSAKIVFRTGVLKIPPAHRFGYVSETLSKFHKTR
ncbi:hypothetical protein NEOLI_003944 [Neolecta irregularis DAH-3]|uniref:Uncharacterized protein n=1 Tax=Neolecta irregularis (strain DAH-3) TaxID=1198029 RepID=A0A1U7LQ40_NEOID|nr:hypothetical protein NEOLI_003944 [Neolecta irregularis DAH-3]|eukprot:OLL24786.1 hypothetical protein NEOLI_003944 [Neolecta irregularis DAH-3]